jgi:hypothetical protein
MDDTFYGTDEQQAFLRRGQDVFVLLRDESWVTYYGRGVGVIAPDEDKGDRALALARLQGVSHYAFVPEAEVAGTVAGLDALGFRTNLYRRWVGRCSVLDAARRVIAEHPLPSDVRILAIDHDSPEDMLEKLARVALAAGVLPPAGRAMRGLARPSLTMLALNDAGDPLSCAGASAFAHSDHPKWGGMAWWGMLATAPERRGQRLALILGAHVLVAMHETFGFEEFFTGVEPGNGPSEALCARMGLAPDAFITITIVDPRALPGGRMTK